MQLIMIVIFSILASAYDIPLSNFQHVLIFILTWYASIIAILDLIDKWGVVK